MWAPEQGSGTSHTLSRPQTPEPCSGTLQVPLWVASHELRDGTRDPPPAHRPTGPPAHRPTGPPAHRPTGPPAHRLLARDDCAPRRPPPIKQVSCRETTPRPERPSGPGRRKAVDYSYQCDRLGHQVLKQSVKHQRVTESPWPLTRRNARALALK